MTNINELINKVSFYIEENLIDNAIDIILEKFDDLQNEGNHQEVFNLIVLLKDVVKKSSHVANALICFGRFSSHINKEKFEQIIDELVSCNIKSVLKFKEK